MYTSLRNEDTLFKFSQQNKWLQENYNFYYRISVNSLIFSPEHIWSSSRTQIPKNPVSVACRSASRQTYPRPVIFFYLHDSLRVKVPHTLNNTGVEAQTCLPQNTSVSNPNSLCPYFQIFDQIFLWMHHQSVKTKQCQRSIFLSFIL